MPRYEYRTGVTGQFWEVEVEDTSVVLRWGRLGESGQQHQQAFDTPELAVRRAESLARQKMATGFVLIQETDGHAIEAVTQDVPALEAALLASPESHEVLGVYADWLLGQGDPLGRLIAAELALAKEGRSNQLLSEIVELRRICSGGLEGQRTVALQWRLGFIAHAEIHVLDVSHIPRVEALLRLPAAQTLRSLRLDTRYAVDSTARDDLFQMMGERAPSTLQTLSVWGPHGYVDPEEPAEPYVSTAVWERLPQVRTLCLNVGGAVVGLPSRQLERLAMALSRGDELSQMIEAGPWPGLHHVALDGKHAGGWLEVVLAELTELVAPRLTHLALHHVGNVAAWLAGFWETSFARQLRTLELSNCAVPVGFLEALSREARHLEAVHLHGVYTEEGGVTPLPGHREVLPEITVPW